MNKLFECVEGNQFKMAEGEIVSETKDKVISKYPQFSNFIGKRIKRIVYKSNGEEMIFEFDDGSKLPVIKTFGEVRQIILGKEFDKRDTASPGRIQPIHSPHGYDLHGNY